MLNKKKNNKGFTLVELLVVIAIIGILAVVAVPALFSNINKAKIADLEADYSAFKSASLSYYSDENNFTSIAGTAGKTTGTTNPLNSYMESIPEKSPFGTIYTLIEANNKLILKFNAPKAGLKDKEVTKLKSDLGTTATQLIQGTTVSANQPIQLVITEQ